VVGEKIMAKLHELDDVAYVRFASVYREFKDVNDFVAELKKLLSAEKAGKTAASLPADAHAET
jgi:transcriptional repressor NrdR